MRSVLGTLLVLVGSIAIAGNENLHEILSEQSVEMLLNLNKVECSVDKDLAPVLNLKSGSFSVDLMNKDSSSDLYGSIIELADKNTDCASTMAKLWKESSNGIIKLPATYVAMKFFEQLPNSCISSYRSKLTVDLTQRLEFNHRIIYVEEVDIESYSGMCDMSRDSLPTGNIKFNAQATNKSGLNCVETDDKSDRYMLSMRSTPVDNFTSINRVNSLEMFADKSLCEEKKKEIISQVASDDPNNSGQEISVEREISKTSGEGQETVTQSISFELYGMSMIGSVDFSYKM